jgi:DNA modification methylase
MDMIQTTQQPLFVFKTEDVDETEEWGTFKDSLRAPIHNWFTYPAGFSYKAVQAGIRQHDIGEGDVIYDPFMGSGTTNLTAKGLGISSYGVEAHPFVFRIARTKLNWEVNKNSIGEAMTAIEEVVRTKRKASGRSYKRKLEAEFPELVLKCFEEKTLLDLWLIRDAISEKNLGPEFRDLLFLALASVLRQVSSVATGWPYIAPNKQKTTSLGKDALVEFSRQVSRMVHDVEISQREASPNYLKAFHRIFNSDSRNTNEIIPSEAADLVFTSPPYLNNFDYADRTRLELYFFGEAKNWGDITKNIRTKLITSATTQISRDNPRYNLSESLKKACPQVADFLSEAIFKLGKLRLTKGGKKSYDHLVSGYFNDMFLVVSDVYRVLRPGNRAIFVLGDSAPYGVHIPTEEVIGKIGRGIGFSDYTVRELRTRGGKWKANPQRHNVPLRESILTLRKP